MNYTELLSVWLKERREEDLQPLSVSFYIDVGAYMMKLREEARMVEKDTTRSRIVAGEKESVERMIQELFHLRTGKIVELVEQGKEVNEERLTNEERSFLSGFRKVIDDHLEDLKSILKGVKDEFKAMPKVSGLRVIRMLADIPAIIGIDLATYGPYRAEDVASMPSENAESLIKRGLAVDVEEES